MVGDRHPAGPLHKEITVKRLVLAVAVLGTAGFLAAAPANAAACATLDANINGTALPLNGTYCLPELPAPPAE